MVRCYESKEIRPQGDRDRLMQDCCCQFIGDRANKGREGYLWAVR